MTDPWIVAFIALWMLVIVIGLLVLGTLRRIVPTLERLESYAPPISADAIPRGLPAGASIPELEAERAGGGQFAISDLRGSLSFVLFLSDECRPCARFVRDLTKDRVPELGARLVVVVESASLAEQVARAQGVTVLIQRERELADVFDSNVTPHAFALDADAVVLASGTPNDWTRLRLLGQAAAKGGESDSTVVAAAS
jgi:hypothetical protein